MEGLQTNEEIDEEIVGGQQAVRDLLGVRCQFFLLLLLLVVEFFFRLVELMKRMLTTL